MLGVLHNGAVALDGAVDCVAKLHESGKALIVLSNTSAPSAAALERLPKFGFDKNHFIGAITSGEEASKYILKRFGSDIKTSRAIFVTWDASDQNNPRLTAHPQQFLAQCGNVEPANSIDEADFVLLHGSEVWQRNDGSVYSLSPFIEKGDFRTVDPILEQCLARRLPLVCANPDRTVRTPSGGSAHMPGSIAARYLALGGEGAMFGKPNVEHFQACVDLLVGMEKSRIAHVGDSLQHDVLGANRCGIPSIFVSSSGIHANELGVDFGELPSRDALETLFEKENGIVPTHVVSAFRL